MAHDTSSRTVRTQLSMAHGTSSRTVRTQLLASLSTSNVAPITFLKTCPYHHSLFLCTTL